MEVLINLLTALAPLPGNRQGTFATLSTLIWPAWKPTGKLHVLCNLPVDPVWLEFGQVKFGLGRCLKGATLSYILSYAKRGRAQPLSHCRGGLGSYLRRWPRSPKIWYLSGILGTVSGVHLSRSEKMGTRASSSAEQMSSGWCVFDV